MSRHVVVIGAGVIGCMSAIEALRQGHRVTIVEPGEPGGEQAASYGNAAWLSSHSVIPPAEPGIWRKVPGYLLDPLGPLSIRPGHFPKAAFWLLRYLVSASTHAKVAAIAAALRPLLIDAPALHAAVAAEAGCGDLIDAKSGLMHVYPARAVFEADAANWRIRRDLGIQWQELDASALRAIQPDLDSRYQFGVLVGEAGHCRNPGAYVAALAGHARTLGANLVRAAARDFRIEGGSLKAVTIDGGEILCDAAVIAAGIRSKALALAAGDAVPLAAERGYHVMLEGGSARSTVPFSASDCKMVVTMVDGCLRAAGQVEIADADAPPNMARAEILKSHLIGMFPALAQEMPKLTARFWLGCRPSMPDGMPSIGRATATGDIIHAFGHGHIGLVSSARTGRVVEQLLSGKDCEIPIAPFYPQRFRRFRLTAQPKD